MMSFVFVVLAVARGVGLLMRLAIEINGVVCLKSADDRRG